MTEKAAKPTHAFTSKAPALANQLITPVHVVVPNTTRSLQVNGIWDTGATASVITEFVVKSLGLIPSGMSEVHTANGKTMQNTYIVEVVLPNGLKIIGVTVTGATALSGGSDVLIGMDIINLGDFSITNFKGITCMSFRTPSYHEVDYCKNLEGKFLPNIKAGQSGSNVTPKKKKRR